MIRKENDGSDETVGVRPVTETPGDTQYWARPEHLMAATGRLAQVGGWDYELASNRIRWTDVTYELLELDPGFKPTLSAGLALCHPQDRRVIAVAMQRALRDGTPCQLRLRLRTGQGRERWMKINGEPIFAKGAGESTVAGAIVGLCGSIQDVTDRVGAERAHRASEARFRSVFDAAPLGIAVADHDRRFLLVNPALERFLGYSVAEMLGKKISDLIHPDDRTLDASQYQALVSGRVAAFTRDKRFLRRDGAVVWGRVTVAMIHDDDSRLHTIGLFNDISEERAAERALRESEQQYRALFESAGEGLSIIQDGRFISINRAGLRMLGHAREETIVGKHPWEVSPPRQPDGEASYAKSQRLVARAQAGSSQRFEWEHLRADGSRVPIEVTLMPVELGGQPSVFVAWHDLTERRAAEERELRARVVFENTSEGIIVTDADQRILAVNRAFREITGYSEDEVRGKTPRLLKSGRHDEAFYQAMWASLNATGNWRGEIWNRRKDGEIFPQLTTISLVRDQSGRLTHYVGVFGDITQIKRSEENLYRLAHHDVLTGLPNRALLRARMEQALQRAERVGGKVGVLFLDLDLFKNVNDTLGHTLGDALLVQVARSMAGSVRDVDTIARLGGDEFSVIMEELDEPSAAAKLAERLLEGFVEPFDVEGRELYITASIGISLFPDDGPDMDTLVSNADLAMYKAKESGRNCYRFFEPQMTALAMERLQLETALRGALVRGELSLVYQPQVLLGDGSLHGVEVLVRWTHPELGCVSPARFIPIAEDIGLIAELGAWVLARACRQLRDWDDAGFFVPRLAVNLSMAQLERQDLVAEIRAILARAGIEADRLELEVTESMLMRHTERVVENLLALKEMGVTVAVDDFGTGYSSLGYLKQLPIGRLKIDKTFVDGLPDDVDDNAIARSIVALARGLGLEVIAEGVESREQADWLRQEGCYEAQGYHFGRPTSAEALREHHLARKR